MDSLRNNSIFTRGQYLKKAFFTFFPRILFKCLPFIKGRQRKHWESQRPGDIHGYEKFEIDDGTSVTLLKEIKSRVDKDEAILDLGCNCGRHLVKLRSEGYTNLSGLDICQNAIDYGRKKFDLLSDVELIVGSFEEELPRLASINRKFDLIYSVGANLAVVYPSFDIIRYICMLCQKYVILIFDDAGHSYPRFWEYEFGLHNFLLTKLLRPFDGSESIADANGISALLVFKRVR
ncbi:MAG: class I SAM-dependent methyltransferase [Deltaproteobacteria bacterium]|nr:class I SAM-dependent methyltransferase [Deltaproteobacteria bacterium]MBW2018592.1 class I SAM-dependent methyltransferase [Deltaproteobacteria bacterium]MBW2073858.1 class I SAM-dependent methyltransferase [Deltaproteobacteria bacterium]